MHWALTAKLIVALGSITTLMSIAITDGFGGVSWLKAYALSAMICAGIMGYLIVWVIIRATIYQWLLRHGARDPQWYFFNADPPGLVRERNAYLQQHGLLKP